MFHLINQMSIKWLSLLFFHSNIPQKCSKSLKKHSQSFQRPFKRNRQTPDSAALLAPYWTSTGIQWIQRFFPVKIQCWSGTGPGPIWSLDHRWIPGAIQYWIPGAIQCRARDFLGLSRDLQGLSRLTGPIQKWSRDNLETYRAYPEVIQGVSRDLQGSSKGH